jgi:hypothetical protein
MPASPDIRRFVCLKNRLSYPGLEFALGPTTSWEDEKSPMYLRVGCPGGRDNRTGAPKPWAGRKWLLSSHMTDGEFVQTAFMAVLAAFEHEARENFKVDGVDVLNPHYDLDVLLKVRELGGALKERTEV